MTVDEGVEWVDVVGPTPNEIQKVARTYHLHRTSVEDCLEPEHLPKHEKIGDLTFVILRAIDERAEPDAATVQAMTRKVAVFYRPGFLLTVRRTDQPFFGTFLAAHRPKVPGGADEHRANGEVTATGLVASLTHAVLDTYGAPLEAVETAVDRIEECLFDRHGKTSLEEIYLLKRRVSLCRRLLWKTQGVIQQLTPSSERTSPVFQDLRESVEGWHFYADELLEDLNNLLSIHLSLASQRTSDVMRVLTVFSAFFLPLTFIAGVYGMNFVHMPELNARWGYPAILIGMAVLSVGIGIWFRRRGWWPRDGSPPAS